MIAREAMMSKLSTKVEAAQSADVEGKIDFPTFQRLSELFGVDLTEKTSKPERDQILLSHTEVLKLQEETDCKTIEEYVVELGENSNEF